MPIRFPCQCGYTLTVPDHRAGTEVRCWNCKEVVLTPLKRKKTSRSPSRQPSPSSPPSRPPQQRWKTDPVAAPAACDAALTQLTTEHAHKSDPSPASTTVDPKVKAAAPKRKPPPLPKSRKKATSSNEPVKPVKVDHPREIQESDQIVMIDEIDEVEPPPIANAAPAPSKPDPEPEPQPDPETVTVGLEHTSSQRWSAYCVASAMVFCALWQMAPAIYDVVMFFQALKPVLIPLWVYLALVVGLLQIVYAFYLFQLPDWGSGWVVTLAMLAQTALFAMLAAVFFFGPESSLAQFLQVAPPYDDKADMWCFLMVCVTALLTYFAGRTSVRWREAAMRVLY